MRAFADPAADPPVAALGAIRKPLDGAAHRDRLLTGLP
jgi:hypothetical protein